METIAIKILNIFFSLPGIFLVIAGIYFVLSIMESVGLAFMGIVLILCGLAWIKKVMVGDTPVP